MAGWTADTLRGSSSFVFDTSVYVLHGHTLQREKMADIDGSPVLLDSRPGPLRCTAGPSSTTEHGLPEGASGKSTRTFWRRAKWSPDGSHILLQGEQHSLETMRLRLELPANADDNGIGQPVKYRLEAGSFPVYQAPAPLLDAAWYPYAHASTSAVTLDQDSDPSDEAAVWAQRQTWCFLSSVRNVPVRLVDAESGKSRTSYAVMDHVERFVAPTAMAFSPYGDRFYAGHDSYLTTHELASSGLNSHTHMALAGPAANVGGPSSAPIPHSYQANTPTSKRAKLRLKRAHRRKIAAVQQRGIVSSLAVCLDPGFHLQDGAPVEQEDGGRRPELVAVGTFSGNVGLYALGRGKSAGECCVTGWKEGRGTGIAQLIFHPTSPNLLFVKSRRSSVIRVYDVRLLCGCLAVDFQARAQASFSGRTSGTLVAILQPALAAPSPPATRGNHLANRSDSLREGSGDEPTRKQGRRGSVLAAHERTQQRRFFDIDATGRWLCAGDGQGTVCIWDVDMLSTHGVGEDEERGPEGGPPTPSNPDGEVNPTNSTPRSVMTKKTLRTLVAQYEARLMAPEGRGDAQASDKTKLELAPAISWAAHEGE